MSVSRHKAVVGVVTDLIGDHCGKPYQKIRLAVECEDQQPDELVTVLTDYNANYVHGQIVQIERVQSRHVVSYRIVKDGQ